MALSPDHEAQLRKTYLRLTSEEAASLRQLQPIISAHLDELVSAFYRHLLQFDETRRLLSDELITNRLMEAQRRYLMQLVGGDYGPEYQAERLKIGHVHERIGLTPQWYLGAYSLYCSLIFPLIFDAYKDRPSQFVSIYTAFRKVVYLDIELAIEAYIQKSNEKLEFANRQLAGLSRELEKGLDQRTRDLKQERDFITTILETSGALVIVLDTQGCIIRFNHACVETSGYSFEEVQGVAIWEILLVPEEVQRAKAAFEEVKAGRALNNYQNFWLTKSGDRRQIMWNATHTMDGKGVVEYVIGVGIDVTELGRTQEQLRQTERLAEIGTLASGMAHEIGTPMNVILGRAEFLQRKTKDPDTAKGLQTIIEQVERITRIMNQLLTFARRRPIERRPIDLNKAVEDTLEVMQERFRRHRIAVKTELAPSLPQAFADPDQMGQVLLNLAINALHAIGDDGTIEVRTAVASVSEHPGESPTEMIELSVSDSGHGIAQDDLDKIFNPFFTTKEVGKGTGLGLTVVHGIVQEHGGQIRVESEIQKGTTFRILLPIASG